QPLIAALGRQRRFAVARTSTITIDILTPQGARRSGVEVPGDEVPGIAGELGILPDHVPLITPIVPGVVRFKAAEGAQRLAVGSGFLEATGDGRVSVLTERALTADEIDVPAAEARLRDVNARLSKESGPIDAIEHRKLVDEQRWLE